MILRYYWGLSKAQPSSTVNLSKTDIGVEMGLELCIFVHCNKLEIYLDCEKNDLEEFLWSWILTKKFSKLRSLVGKCDHIEEINLGIIIESEQVTIILSTYRKTKIIDEIVWQANKDKSSTEAVKSRDSKWSLNFTNQALGACFNLLIFFFWICKHKWKNQNSHAQEVDAYILYFQSRHAKKRYIYLASGEASFELQQWIEQ